jgi:hypothetical protein
MRGNNCSLSSAFKIGFILCIVGIFTITVGLFFVPLVVERVCDQQRAPGQKTPDILNYPQVGEKCTKVLTTGILALLSVPAIILLLVGLFILIMAGTNRIFA